ncbi:glycosyltransferase family 4 protein [Pseudonocardia sp. WMMC193]|uniref:glycosyltransferase family 4 protein n=1 Tax=Pseudonocardia sp. WMMC193 TaxID=2911965 RepID=UPI001F2D96F7|nr:glycosyltransferase family 4 protein [Pseudonocardia sp. WMMC193]MCF7553456.1 glycosyltransferase family 4 protein [Pseudonocardia sp. WMMC193]
MRAVLPADVDDPRRPSGGNVYDRRILTALAGPDAAVAPGSASLGGLAAPGAPYPVAEVLAAGAWPHPAPADLTALAAALAAVPAGETVLLDGLVACAAPTVVVPEAARLRLVVLVHLPLGDEAGAHPALESRERAVLHAAAAVVATSAWSAERLRAVHGLADVAVVRPGVDPAPVAPGSGGGALLCVGSLTPTKGQDVLLAALDRLADTAWTCRLVGSPDRAPEFAAALARHPRVTLVGPLTGAALDAEFAAADLLVQPSRRESYGMVATEALARGLPVVASDVGGVREAVGDAALLVPAEDPAALAAALHRVLADPAPLRRAALARRAGLRTWPQAAGELHTILVGVAA